MSNQLNLPNCGSCNHPILPGEKAVKLQCPSCGNVQIWRCEKCRQFIRDYTCPDCKFVGPWDVIKMGLLVARIKILPQDVAIKPDQLLKDISDALLEGMAIRNSTEEPIAFGLVALIADIKFEDKEGSMEELENLLNSIENISQIEVKAVSKLSTSV